MQAQFIPDTLTKLAQLGDTTLYEPSGDQPQTERHRVPYQSRSLSECITNVMTPQDNDNDQDLKGDCAKVDGQD
jgi:hypothetical protein